jgi:plastocyanin
MQNTRRPTAAALLAALAVALLSLGLGAAPAQAASYTVTIKQYQFGGGALTVQQGDTVTWVNEDDAPHDVTVTAGPATFRSPMLQKGQRWSYTLGTPGTYSYMCSVHPDMRATLTVKAKPVPAPKPVAPSAMATHSMAAAPGTPTGAAPPKPAPSATAGGAPSAAPSATAAPAVPAAASVAPVAESGLNPLLLVAGVAVAVVVFCLLLLASRPAPVAAAPEPVAPEPVAPEPAPAGPDEEN